MVTHRRTGQLTHLTMFLSRKPALAIDRSSIKRALSHFVIPAQLVRGLKSLPKRLIRRFPLKILNIESIHLRDDFCKCSRYALKTGPRHGIKRFLISMR